VIRAQQIANHLVREENNSCPFEVVPMSISPLTRISLATALIAAGGKSSAQPGAGRATSTGTAGGATATAAAAATAPIDGPQDRCEVHVTGDDTFSFVGTRPRATHNGKIAAESDYWMSDDQLRQALSMLGSIGNKKSQGEIDARVAAAMAKDPRFMLLVVNCGVDGQGFFNLSPINTSRYADVPYQPGHYALLGNDGKPGDFRAMLSIEPNGKREGFHVTEPGTVELTRFDDTGLAGTFAFKAATYDGKKSVAVTGSFDYGCEDGAHCRH
jgi:hypothetical protein